MNEALQLLAFLYASMPMPDSVDYSRDYWLQNIETTLTARQEMSWGSAIPDREFRHFVLPVRVNNENLDDSRQVFFDELKGRVNGLSMSDAILEVNHWCHERVTYTPSDERTSAPLATIRTAYGRCGEESTLLVAALRSVCIPARQVYTPRWAHTDDNHAWVEAWADGEWHFLGACEPEPVLDLGWFNAPASRGMLMHTKVFGQYDGPEVVMQRNACFTEIDVTSHYAPVGHSYVRVVDAGGKSVPGAMVDFKIYNYAEFYTVATHVTDGNGVTSMQAGIGDLVAWASHEGRYGFARFPVGASDTLTLVLDHQTGERYSLDMQITPPRERNTIPSMTDEQKIINQRRLAYEDSLRLAYVATFPHDASLRAARGNYLTIRNFLASAEDEARAQMLLSSLSDKDMRDVTREVLDDSYRLAPSYQAYRGLCDSLFFARYVLNPRIANEQLTPYRSYLLDRLTPTQKHLFSEEPEALIKWISDSIGIDELHNPQQLRMSPIGSYRHRVTDRVSRSLLFVAMARTVGLPARIDPVTGKTQYQPMQGRCDDNQWISVQFEQEQETVRVSATGTLSLTYEPQRYLTDPHYFSHFTLSRIDDGRPTLLNYAEEDTWQSLFGSQGEQLQSLDAGDYLLTTGTRMADGSVLVHLEVAPVVADETLTLPLSMRQAEQGLQVIGSLNAEHLYRPEASPTDVSILSTTGRGFYVLGIIAPSAEPSTHALRDIAQYREEFDEWGGALLLLFRNAEEASRFRRSDYPSLPQRTVFGIDVTGAIGQELRESLHLTESSLPVFVIADTFNRVVFLSEGYTIGLGEKLMVGIKGL